jgi:hypothetical protein
MTDSAMRARPIFDLPDLQNHPGMKEGDRFVHSGGSHGDSWLNGCCPQVDQIWKRRDIADNLPEAELSSEQLVQGVAQEDRPTAANRTPNRARRNSGFDIDLNFGRAVSRRERNAFQAAAARWESVVRGDLPDYRRGNQRIDDLSIDVRIRPLDGAGNTLGQAGPTLLRQNSSLPITGTMEFDSADLDRLAPGLLKDLVIHEMGHVLGLGTLWDIFGLTRGAGTNATAYRGNRAVAAYNDLTGRNGNVIPLENTGGFGTRDFHWRESIFDNEIMTGYLNASNNRLSAVTIGALADLGYRVNFGAADPFTL